MNNQLVESLVQVIQTLPEAEQSMLKQRLVQAAIPSANPQHIAILHPLIITGQILPPSHSFTDHPLSEPEFRTIVSQIKISGIPISETAIEDRGEW
jgi:hypothetical protein